MLLAIITALLVTRSLGIYGAEYITLTSSFGCFISLHNSKCNPLWLELVRNDNLGILADADIDDHGILKSFFRHLEHNLKVAIVYKFVDDSLLVS